MNSTENKPAKSIHFKEASDFSVAIDGDFAAASLLRHMLISSGISITNPKSGTLTLRISRNGMQLQICDECGTWYDGGHSSALVTLIFFLSGGRELAAPAHAPGALEQIAAEYDGRILRIGRDEGAATLLGSQCILCDAFEAALYLCNFLAKTKTTIRKLSHLLPDFTIISRELLLTHDRSEILKNLSSYNDGMHKEGQEHLRVCADGGWISIFPSHSRNSLRITGEGMSEEIANELCNIFIERAHDIDMNGAKK